MARVQSDRLSVTELLLAPQMRREPVESLFWQSLKDNLVWDPNGFRFGPLFANFPACDASHKVSLFCFVDVWF